MELKDQMLLTVTTKTGKAIVLNVDVLDPKSQEAEVEVVVNESHVGFCIVVNRDDLEPIPPPEPKVSWEQVKALLDSKEPEQAVRMAQVLCKRGSIIGGEATEPDRLARSCLVRIGKILDEGGVTP